MCKLYPKHPHLFLIFTLIDGVGVCLGGCVGIYMHKGHTNIKNAFMHSLETRCISELYMMSLVSGRQLFTLAFMFFSQNHKSSFFLSKKL